MTIVELSLVLLAVSIAAGMLGSLLGLGGGFVVVPVLTLVFHLDIRLAIGTSIVAVAATSSAAAARNVGESITNLRIATFLALATTLGAVSGALLAGVFDARFLFGLFGIVLALSGVRMILRKQRIPAVRDPAPALVKLGAAAVDGDGRTSRLADRLALHSAYYDEAEGADVSYLVANTGLGLVLMYLAGTLSGLLGIGSGVLKVPAMDLAMHIPMKVSTATSNLLIGLTAAASAVVYFAAGRHRSPHRRPGRDRYAARSDAGIQVACPYARRSTPGPLCERARRGRLRDDLEGDRLTAPARRGYGARTPPSPRGVRAVVGKVLHAGVLTSAGILLVGYLVDLIREPAAFGSRVVEQAHLKARASFPHSFATVWDGISRGNGEAIIVAGILVLILTPVAGVITSAVAFAQRRDWLFTIISASVLSVILGSFLLGWLSA